MPLTASTRTPVAEVVDRPRDLGAVLVGAAAVILLTLLLVSGGGSAGGPVPDPADTDTDAPGTTGVDGPLVVALRPVPWLEQEVDALAVVTTSGGRAWTVDFGTGVVTEHRLDQAEHAFTPIDAVVDGHLVSHWDGQVVAVPLAGGAPVRLGRADRRIPQPIAFPSERPGAVWVVEPTADDDRVVATERALDGTPIQTAATSFPLFSAPMAAVGGGLLAPGQGRDVVDLEIVDPATGARRHLVETPRGGLLVAARGNAVVVTGPPCTPGCPLTVVDASTGVVRTFPPADRAGVRSSEGSISPDGTTLVHSVSTTLTDDPRPRYVVTDLVSGASRLTDVTVGPGVAWTADGGAFVAAPRKRGGRGSDARLVVHHLATGRTEVAPVLVRIPTREPWVLGG